MFILFMILCMIFIGLPISLWKLYSQPLNRKNQIIKMLLWILCVACISFIHQIRANNTKEEVNQIVLKIENYKNEHKKYPASLEDLGVDSKQFKEKVTQIYYFSPKDQEENEFKKPTFMYPSSFSPLDRYYYKFDVKEWIFVPD